MIGLYSLLELHGLYSLLELHGLYLILPLYIYIYIYIWKIFCKPKKRCKLVNLWNPIKILWNVSIFHIFIIIDFPYISYFHISYESISSLDYFDQRLWLGLQVYTLSFSIFILRVLLVSFEKRGYHCIVWYKNNPKIRKQRNTILATNFLGPTH